MDYYVYDKISIEKGRILVQTPSVLRATKAVTDDFWVKFNGIDISSIPESIANIPYLLNIAPVVWALNLRVRVQVIDRALLESLQVLRNALHEMYPDLSWSGEIVADNVVTAANVSNVHTGVFFSGGLDSVFTTMRCIDSRPLLFTVRGADILLSDDIGWALVNEQIDAFAKTYGLSRFAIESNFKAFLNEHVLGKLSKYMPSWWGGVQHGMGFAGLVAPASQKLDISTFYIASSHSTEFSTPWGSDPKIDNHIRYAGVTFVHDGYEFTRHAKVAALTKIVSDNFLSTPRLHVCYENTANAGKNCCKCEKCTRTITSLLVEGKDLVDYGFDVNIEKFAGRTIAAFKAKRFTFTDSTLFFWQDIQSSLSGKRTYADKNVSSYLTWLSEFDFPTYKDQSQLKRKRLDPVVNLLRGTPLFAIAKRTYKALT
jgi:hypothetical protein